MSLMKEIATEVNNYKTFVNTINEKVNQLLREEASQTRIGLTLEVSDYYQNANRQPNDTVDFQPQGNVAKPQQIAQPLKGGDNGTRLPSRVQLLYNPATDRVEHAIKGSNPPEGYVQPDAQQLHGAINKINMVNHALADKIVSGEVSLWIPKNPQQAPQSPMAKQSINKMELSPEKLAAAHQAADQMSLAK